MTEEQYAALAQLWHEYMLLGPKREDLALDRTGRALMFCQWMDSDPDEDPVYGLPDILAFFDEKERREGTAGPLETMSEQATRDWHRRAIVRIKETVTTGSVDPWREHTFRAGEELEMIQWGNAGRLVDRSRWWTSYDIDGAFIIKSDKVEIIRILEEGLP